MDELRVNSSIRDYSVIFVDDFSEPLAGDLENSFFLIDKCVSELYSEKLQNVLQRRHLIVEATESNKTLDFVKLVVRFLLADDIKRNDRLVAIGGGIVQDIAGFVASILFRGIEWVFYPTTLLAQCDSCIGSKTSINVDKFKNQLGTFYPPQRVVLDINFLKTLSLTDIKSGLGEIIKVHLLDGADSLEYISSQLASASWLGKDLILDLILRSLTIKKKIIEKDEFDRDYRNILNYGHSFGHAIESATDYKVCHGQAVTIGMDMANYISLKLGLLPQKWYDLMGKVLRKNYPDVQLEQAGQIMTALAKDKKRVDQNVELILTKGPGKMLKVGLPEQSIKQFLGEYLRCTR